jgi:hypothetical protein
MLVFTKEEKDILVGSLLGDGCLRIMSRATVPAFSVSHGEREKDYVFWKYEKLKRWVNTPPWREERVYHKDRTRKLGSWRFQTLSKDAFSELYRLFYRDRRKIVPDNIATLLQDSLLSLAVWIMDDGNRNHDAIFLNTQYFTPDEQAKLVEALGKAYGLGTTINKHSVSKGKQLYRIRVNTESTKRFCEIAGHYILPQFRYKIPNFIPVTTEIDHTIKVASHAATTTR